MTTIRAAILKCDDVLDKFERVYGGYPEMISASFKAVDSSVTFDVFDSQQMEKPDCIDDYEFYVITGSKLSVYDELPWINDLVDFVKKLEKRNAKLFGICFGHQLIALSRGCIVRKSEKGWGVGVSCNRIVDKSFFGADKSDLKLLVSHQDQVESLVNGARLIATSSFCENFLVAWSKNTISVQGHPEWVKAYSKDLMNDRRDRIDKELIEAGITSLTSEIDNLEFNRAILKYLLDR